MLLSIWKNPQRIRKNLRIGIDMNGTIEWLAVGKVREEEEGSISDLEKESSAIDWTRLAGK